MNYETVTYKGNQLTIGYVGCSINYFEIKEILYNQFNVYELLEFDIDFITELLVERLYY